MWRGSRISRQRVRRLFFAWATPGYLGTIALGTALLVAMAMTYASWHGWRGAGLVFVALLTVVPASELVIQLFQRVISSLIPPRRLPRLELDRVPASARTMVIVPTLLDSVERVEELIAHLEVQALGNVDPRIHFALLSDFPDAAAETQPQDADILEAARAGIAELNRKHAGDDGGRFFLFHRLRQWNPREGLWMGWERKRGKIEEFNRLLRGATDTSFTVAVGDLSILPDVKYCITLDSDTRLPRGVACELIGIIAHPLNRATFDPRAGRVTEGYGILQPRISVTFMSAAGSLFARLYAGHTGVDPYSTAVSDTYQDLFAEGIFTGKGLYDVDAFVAALEDSVPENALLSHDLFEGLHARVGLVSDVELVDDYPSSVLSHARRQHRWVRGDWQILFWLFPFVPSQRGLKRNPLTAIGRWKILDNLRRSLVAPALLALLLAGWLVLPGQRGVWTAIVVSVAASQLLPVLARLLIGPARSQSLPVFLTNLRDDASTTVAQILLSLTLLAFHARRCAPCDRADARAAGGHEAPSAGMGDRRQYRGAGGWTGGQPRLEALRGRDDREPARGGGGDHRDARLAAGRAARGRSVPAALGERAGARLRAQRPVGPRVRPLRPDERARLRRTARTTWRYFETFVTDADGWLPPDNFQEGEGAEPGRVARRTSPTNIGMGLLSTVAAHDLGYLPTDRMVDRLAATLRTVESLERFEGHLLNWYDTATRAPLMPRYISTVDSGNLAAALLATAQGLQELERRPQSLAQRLEGLGDTAGVLRGVSATTNAGADARRAIAAINSLARGMASAAGGPVSDEQLATITAYAAELEPAAAELDRLERTPEIDEVSVLVSRRAGRRGQSRADARRPGRSACSRSSPACVPSRMGCASTSCTTGGAASSRSATASPTPMVPAAPTGRSTICWRRRRGWPASWRLPRATCRSTTGSILDAWSPTSTAVPPSSRGAARCSST